MSEINPEESGESRSPATGLTESEEVELSDLLRFFVANQDELGSTELKRLNELQTKLDIFQQKYGISVDAVQHRALTSLEMDDDLIPDERGTLDALRRESIANSQREIYFKVKKSNPDNPLNS